MMAALALLLPRPRIAIRHVMAQMTEPKPPKGERRRNTPDDTRRKLDAKLAAKKAKPSGDALVWKDCGVRDASRGGRHGYQANVVQGTFTITPAVAFPSLTFSGYSVDHKPTGGNRRVLANGVKTVKQAKAIAQADHDAGNDARP
jgi:hypothetical protein